MSLLTELGILAIRFYKYAAPDGADRAAPAATRTGCSRKHPRASASRRRWIGEIAKAFSGAGSVNYCKATKVERNANVEHEKG